MNSEMGPHPRSLASPPPIGQPGDMSMHKALRMWSTMMPGQSCSSKQPEKEEKASCLPPNPPAPIPSYLKPSEVGITPKLLKTIHVHTTGH